MELVVAVDERWAIGREGALLFAIPEDLHRFKTLTLGKPIVLGRKTLETFPGRQPLLGRANLVLTHHGESLPEGFEAITLEDVPEDGVVVGGADVYRQLLDRCTIAHVTKIFNDGQGDAFFPNLDAHPEWTLDWQSEEKNWNGLKFCFCEYTRVS